MGISIEERNCKLANAISQYLKEHDFYKCQSYPYTDLNGSDYIIGCSFLLPEETYRISFLFSERRRQKILGDQTLWKDTSLNYPAQLFFGLNELGNTVMKFEFRGPYRSKTVIQEEITLETMISYLEELQTKLHRLHQS